MVQWSLVSSLRLRVSLAFHSISPTALAARADDKVARALTIAHWRFWTCLVLGTPLLALSLGDVFGFLPEARNWEHAAMLQLGLATPIVFWGGAELFRRFGRSVRSWTANTWTLLGLGVGTAYVYSGVAVLAPELFSDAFRIAHDGGVPRLPLYFDSVAVIVTLMLLGKVLELRAGRSAAGAIRELLALAPETAARVDAKGDEEVVPVSELRVGDSIRIRPGDRIAVDGVVIEGSSPVDESMLTGEFQQVTKIAGDEVVGGTMNITGSLLVRVTRVGDDRVLARIVRLVAQVRESRAPIQDFAEHLVGQFVPLVVMIVLAAFAFWAIVGEEPRLANAIQHAMAVLIVATPCALGLAAPISMLVGTSEAARSGVLIKNAMALQTLSMADAILLDKTGTITTGHPELVGIDAFDERYDPAKILATAAGLEAGSEHPLAAAIRRAAQDKGVTPVAVTDFDSTPGLGVHAHVNGRKVGLGNVAFLHEHGVELGDLEARADDHEDKGRTIVWLFDEARCVGILALADTIKPSARVAIDALRRQGCEIVIITGDSEATARAVARELWIEDIHANVKPEDKAVEIDRWRFEGWITAMAGDGVNDAPALVAADVGIAMSTGSDVAIESADVTLVGGDIRGIVRARELSRRTLRNIKQNITYAFLFHAIAIPVAAGFFAQGLGLRLTPGLVALVMALGTMAVIINSFRLRWMSER